MSIYRSPFALSDPSPELLSLTPVESFSTTHKGISIRTNTPYPPITKLPSIVLSNDLGFSEPTPIQAYAIPVIEHGHPALIRAPTGMGKTLCFLLPVIKNVRSNSQGVQLCVVVPTRELCEQIKAEGQKLLKKSDVKIKAVYGRQKERFHENGHAALLVATPGRLLDLLGKKVINFSSLKYFVLDEADRLLDMGFGEDLRAIRRFVPKDASVSLFSATYPDALKRIIDDFLPADRRVFVEVEQESVKNIEQRFLRPRDKREELLRILRECKLQGKSWKGDELDRVIIFVEKKSTASDLEDYLRREGINCYSLHGDKRQEERTTVMNRFRGGLFPVLVATSIAARGIDVKDVKLVVNFDLPKDIKDYVHRIGRTGREGKKGCAVSFLDSSISPDLFKDLMAVVEESGNEVPQLLQAKGPAARRHGHGHGRGGRESSGSSRRPVHVPEIESLAKKTASLNIKEKEEASDEDVMGGW